MWCLKKRDINAPLHYLVCGELQKLTILSLGQHFEGEFSELDMNSFRCDWFCDHSLKSVSPLDIPDNRKIVDLSFVSWIVCLGRTGTRRKESQGFP